MTMNARFHNGFWRFTPAAALVVLCWRMPDIITASSAWR